MIVTTRASDSEPQHPPRNQIHTFVAFVGAPLHWLRLIPPPGPLTQHGRSGNGLLPLLSVELVSRNLRLNELVIRHVGIESFDHPVAIDIAPIKRHVTAILGIQSPDI